jgi:hypothetical protein
LPPEAHRQSGTVAASPHAKEDRDFIDGVSYSGRTVSAPRKRIDTAALQALTDAMPMQPESAGEFVRRMRYEGRY